MEIAGSRSGDVVLCLTPSVSVCILCLSACTGFANNAAVAFEVQLQQSFTPLVAMAAMIHVQPYYPALAKQFDVIAAELIAQVCVASGQAVAAAQAQTNQHVCWCVGSGCSGVGCAVGLCCIRQKSISGRHRATSSGLVMPPTHTNSWCCCFAYGCSMLMVITVFVPSAAGAVAWSHCQPADVTPRRGPVILPVEGQ